MIKRFVRDMLTYLPSQVLPALIGLITAPILTRLLLPAEFGNWALATGVSDFLFAFVCSGIGSAAFRFFPAYKARSDLNSFFASLMVMLSLVIVGASVVSGIVLFLFGTYLPNPLRSLMFIAILIFVAQSLSVTFLEILRVQNRSGLYTWLNLSINYGGLFLGLILVVAFDFRVEGLMLGTLTVILLGLPLIFRVTMNGLHIDLRHLRTSDIFTFWQYAWPLAIGNMAMWGLRLSDRFVIGLFRSETEVGLYSAVYNLSDKTIAMLVSLFMLSMGPMLINTWEAKGRAETESALGAVTRLFLIICLPATVGLSLLALPFVTLLTGEAYHDGYHIVGYVAFSTFTFGLSRIAGWGLLVHSRTRQFALNQTLAAAVNLGLTFLLVPQYGFVAAGVTTLVGYALLLILQAYSSQRYVTWHLPRKMLLNVLFATIVMGIIVFWINSINTQGDTHLPLLMLSVLAGASVYFGTLWLLGEIKEGEKEVVKKLCLRLVGRPV
jgi:O-antigen/teichoic acid export membrane protein